MLKSDIINHAMQNVAQQAIQLLGWLMDSILQRVLN